MNEMKKLIVLLVKNNIEFELNPWICGGEPTLQVCSPNIENCAVDAVSHKFSYGGEKGLLEVMGSANSDEPNEDVDGWLTAEKALKYFINSKEK